MTSLEISARSLRHPARPALAPLLAAIAGLALPNCGGTVSTEQSGNPQLVPSASTGGQPSTGGQKATGGQPATGGAIGGGTSTGGAQTGGSGGTEQQRAMLYCSESSGASLVEGMNPVRTVDSFAMYSGVSMEWPPVRPPLEVVEQYGTPCTSSSSPESCLEIVDEAVATDPTFTASDYFEGTTYQLFMATGPDVKHLSGMAGAASTSGEDDVLPIATAPAMLEFLGEIDTPNEAALVMWLNGREIGCELFLDGDEWMARGRYQISDCPFTYQDFELRVGEDGSYSEQAVGEPEETGGCAGRRPDGLCPTTPKPHGDGVARWLAHTAHLELASVGAFLLLERELRALGAPQALLVRLRKAAADETRHATEVSELARARGGHPPEVRLAPRRARTLYEIALENAVEGCVRETWGALCAHHQALNAQDRNVSRTFARIACEETEHAELSRDLAEFFEANLDHAERERIRQAKAIAADELNRELDRDVAPELVTRLGLPTRQRALEMFSALRAQVLAA